MTLRVAVLVDSPRVSRYLLDLVDWLATAPGVAFVGAYRAQRGYPPKRRDGELDYPGQLLAGIAVAARPGGGLGRPFARLFCALDQWLSGLPREADAMRGRGRIAVQPVPAAGIDCDLLLRAGMNELAAWHAARGSRYGAIGLDFPLDAAPSRHAVGLDEVRRGHPETGLVLYRILAAGPRVTDCGPPGLSRQTRVSPWPANVIRHGWYPTRRSLAGNRVLLYGHAVRLLKDAVAQCAAVHALDAGGVRLPWPPDPQAMHDAGRPVAAMLNPGRLGVPSLGRQLGYGYRKLRRRVSRLRAWLGRREPPWHPDAVFRFEWAGLTLLCPQTADKRGIVVYRADERASATVLLPGVRATGTVLFEADGRWWLLTNLDRTGTARIPATADFASELHLFHADYPLSGDWTPHPLNPLRIDARGAQNAGLLRDDHAIYRCGRIYRFGEAGCGLAFYRITVLSEDAYREVLMRVIEPGQMAAGVTVRDLLRAGPQKARAGREFTLP